MDELQSSGVNSTAADQVEIFDNGVHLGFANVANGQWSLTGGPLPVGEHALTAKYKGMTTTVPWGVVVQGVEHLDDFESAPLGWFETIVRPHYHGVTRYTGDLGTSNPPANPPTQIYQSGWEGAGNWLKVCSIRSQNSVAGNFDTIYTMVFSELYTAVSFRSESQTSWGGRGFAKVEAFDEDGVSLAFHDFPASTSVVVVRLIAPKGKFIKSLVFDVRWVSGTSLALHVRVDSINMVR